MVSEIIGLVFALFLIMSAIIISVEYNRTKEWDDIFRKDGRDD